jgi:hypothetical protein
MHSNPALMRHQIGALMRAGLKTKTQPRPATPTEFGLLLAEVRELAPGNLKAKLRLTGFVDKPHGPDQMRCQECMYYMVHSKCCDLPELALPVEPDWWCRLWRI